MTPPEVALWTALRKRPGGFKFRRQCPIGPYVLDFACLSKRLAIEVDGEAHNRADRPAKDALRDAFLGEQGFKTIRFAASDVMNEMQAVVDAIMAECLVREPLHHPSDGPPPRTGEDEF